MRLAFLVYDSRSGSTLVAKNLAERLADVWVTPELRFDAVLRRGVARRSERRARDWWILASGSGRLRNIGLDSARAIAAIDALGPGCSGAQVARALIEAHVQHVTRARRDVVVVKSGAHAFVWRAIHEGLAEARFLHVVRDPRAVVSSKLRAVRPYYPDERMAWGGVGLAAVRWCMYQRTMQAAEAAGAKVLEIRYEEFLASPEATLERAAEFLGTRVTASSEGKYSIPERERSVHGLVEGDELFRGRIDGWRGEISPFDQRVVEAICVNDMCRKGYCPDRKWTLSQRLLVAGRAAPRTGMLILIHFGKVVRRRLHQKRQRATPR